MPTETEAPERIWIKGIPERDGRYLWRSKECPDPSEVEVISGQRYVAFPNLVSIESSNAFKSGEFQYLGELDYSNVRADAAPRELKWDEQKAREIVKHIADAAIKLAFVRHDLTSDEYDEPEDTDAAARAAAFQAFVDEIKDDTLNCLTGDETGCLDPEDLNATNCELMWLREFLAPDQCAAPREQELKEALTSIQRRASVAAASPDNSAFMKEELLQIFELATAVLATEEVK